MKKMKRWASVLLILCMLLAGTPAPAESSGAFTATPTAEQSAEPTNTATAEPTNTATAEPENTATAEPTNTASSITYGQTLADSTLTSADAHGTFDREDKTIAPEVGAHGYNVIYTPSDTDNYDYTDVTRIQQVSIAVTAKNIADESIAATIPEQTYTGEARTPEVAVTDGAHTLAANTDYTVAYSNNINAGDPHRHGQLHRHPHGEVHHPAAGGDACSAHDGRHMVEGYVSGRK